MSIPRTRSNWDCDPLPEVAVQDAGPSLVWATASVTKKQTAHAVASMAAPAPEPVGA
jgi:hypothetical protein